LAGDQLSSQQVVEIGLESDSSQSYDDAQIFESFDFALQKRSAVDQFLGQRLVAGRRTAGGGGYVETGQHLAIVAGGRGGQQRKSGFVQHRVHEVAGGVSGERAAGAIGAVGAGSESEHEDAGMGIAEAGNGLAPVLAVAESAALLAGYALAIFNQPRTAHAGDDFDVQNLEPVGGRHAPSLYLVVWRGHSCPRLLLLLLLLLLLSPLNDAGLSHPRDFIRCTLFADKSVRATRKARAVTLVGRSSPFAV